VSWNRAGASDAAVDDSWYELGRVDDFRADAFFKRLQQEHSGYPAVKARVKALWKTFKRKEAKLLIDHFDKTPGEPVPFEGGIVARALRELAREGVLALEDRSGKTYSHGEESALALADLPESVLVEATAPPPPPPEDLPVHKRVAATYDSGRNAVVVSWVYPEKRRDDVTWKTLVQRYVNAQGWERGKEYPVDLDQTHETNRYIGGDETHADERNLTPGAWYHYYVFLVELRGNAEPKAVLSRSFDVHIPEKEEPERPDVLFIPAKPRRYELLAEVEKRVMSPKYMSADSRVRKVELRLRGLQHHPAIEQLGAALRPRDGTVETMADITFTMKAELSRQQVMDLVRKLPEVEALYEATLYLRLDTEEGN
jgi:hypothetical protein